MIAVAALTMAWLVAGSKPGQRLEYAFADLGASALLHEVDSDIVIIAIDAKSLANLQQWPWPRRYHA